MVSFRKIFAAVLAPVFLSGTTQAKGLFETESTHSLVSRQVASGNICAEVDLTLLGIVIARDVCVCLAAGVITPASLTRVTQTIRANQGVLAPIINVVGGVTGATTRVVSGLAPLVLQEGTTCTYPTNSVPNQCGGCGYECADGYYACGNQCILNSRACVSGVPQRRALQARDNSAALCPTGFEACLLPGSTAKSLSQFSGFECIKTNSDLESCGGCVNPLPGKPTGSDCSSIPNIASASCTSGQCVVESCIKGFKLIDGACVAVTNGKKLSGYWEALSEAGKEAGKIAIQV